MRVLPVNEGAESRSLGIQELCPKKIQFKEEVMKTILRIALVSLSLVTCGVAPVLADGPIPQCPNYPKCINAK